MNSIYKKIFTNKKVLTALIALIAAVVASFGFEVSPEVSQAINALIAAIVG